MSLTDWNYRLPVELQAVPWDCAAASLTWCLNTIGRNLTEAQVVAGLGPERISRELGLLDASGGGLVDYLEEQGIEAQNNPVASWFDVVTAAGFQPMLIGGRNWYHWTGVRLSNYHLPTFHTEMLALANPAPGYMGIHQTLVQTEFSELGPFSAVWFVSW